MTVIHILHENHAWTEPLKQELDALDLPHVDWHLDEGWLDLCKSPPHGVFYNRMSASSHTRGHRYAPEYAASVLAWLERHGRRVINPTSALRLEVSKVAQYSALEAHGIRTPRTAAVVGVRHALEAARAFQGRPFITKHNRAGRGLGVRRFDNLRELERHLHSDAWESPIDGTLLIQEYIQSPDPYITRLEFIGGRFLYALRVDTSNGFLLCPSDECAADPDRVRFEVLPEFRHALIARCESFLSEVGVDVAGVEFILDGEGRAYVYDINTNTNYNVTAENRVGVNAMRSLATYLGDELHRLSQPAQARLALAN